MAPEILESAKEGYDAAPADVFAFGIILFIMIFGTPPFNQASRHDNIFRYMTRKATAHFLFKVHPKTKGLHSEGKIDTDLVDLLT